MLNWNKRSVSYVLTISNTNATFAPLLLPRSSCRGSRLFVKRDYEYLSNSRERMGLRILRVVPRRLGVAALNAVVAALVLFAPRFVPAVEAQTPANDAATFAVSATPSAITEGETATVTVAISNGVTFTEDQTITLAVSGTASSDDYEVKPKSLRLTLPAGESSATVELEGLEDDEEEEAETVTITASHGGVVIGSATVTITSISHDATLSALSLSGIDIGTFSGAETSYTVYVEEAVETTTVTATANHPEAEVSIDPGTEVRLAAGDNEITVTVTAEDGLTTETYTVTVVRHVRPLTAFFLSPPAFHVGSGTFSLRIVFSEPIATGFWTLKVQCFQEIQCFQVKNGEVRSARRMANPDDLWDLDVTPASAADVAVSLPPTTDCAAARALCTESGKPLSNRLTVLIPGPANTHATGLPEIVGTPRVDETLTASTAGITDEDGLENATFAYQWLANNGTEDTDIDGATNATYEVAPADAGKVLKVRVTFTDDKGHEETLVSAATEPVAAGQATAVAVLRASDGTWTDGETVRVLLGFSEPVTVSAEGGTPTVGIGLDGSARQAAYASGSHTGTLAVFAYTVTADDGTVSAVSLTADSLALNGGTIRDAAGRDVDLGHPGIGGATEETETERVPALTGLVLVDTASGTETALADGDALVLADPANGSWGLVASVSSDAGVGSVRLVLTGARTVTVATDNAAPYSLHGDADGTVTGAGLPAGSYTLTATAYAEADGAGAKLGTLTVSFTVAASEAVDAAALTASFEGVPAAHGGSSPFTFRVRFSQEPRVSYTVLRDESFAVTGGEVRKARRVDGRNDLREIHIEPEGWEDVTVRLAGGRACGTTGAICTADDTVLGNTAVATVPGPLALRVADARVNENAGEPLAFAVTLSRGAAAPVTVAYATADGTATAGADYTATSGTLTFAPGETAQTVPVPVLDDAHDDTGETLTLTLSNATGARIRDGAATGTIVNADPLQQAWLARFGRTVATHVTDAVGERLRGSPGQDSHLTVGGYRLPLGQRAAAADTPTAEPDEPATDARGSALLQGVARLLGLGPGATPAGRGGTATDPWLDAPATDPRLGRSQTVQPLRLREVLVGSSFRLTLGAADDAPARTPRLTAWGRVAATRFDGRDGTLTLDGDMLTGTVGVDGAWDRLLAGVAVAHSQGDGSYTGAGDSRGDLEQTLTSLHPYLRYAVTDRLDVWGLLGYGWGELELAMETGETRETDTNLMMGAFGGRGILLPAAETGGFELATRTDAMLTRTTSEAVAGLAADAEAHRLRLILEGSRGFAWEAGRSFTPTVEVGLRHDWGDAETGFGLELGGRVQYADPAMGLTIEAAVRGLLAHEDRDYEEWGASGTVRLDPGASGRGLSLTLAPTWGAASSGVDGLWSRQTTAGLAPSGTRRAQAGRLNAQVGYGLWLPSTGGLVTPFTGVSVTDGDGWRTRAGLLFVRPDTWGGGLRLELAGESSTTAVGQSEQTIGLQLHFTFGRGRGAAPETPGRGGTVRATPVRSPTAPDGVGPGSRTPTPTRADPGRRQGAVTPPATAQTSALQQETSPASALDRADGPRYFVQLGLFSNHADAIKAKTDLAGDLRDLLHHRLAVVRSTGTGRARVVYVQPFPTPDAAAVLCAAIQTHGPACAVTAAWPGDPHGRRVAAALPLLSPSF